MMERTCTEDVLQVSLKLLGDGDEGEKTIGRGKTMGKKKESWRMRKGVLFVSVCEMWRRAFVSPLLSPRGAQTISSPSSSTTLARSLAFLSPPHDDDHAARDDGQTLCSSMICPTMLPRLH